MDIVSVSSWILLSVQHLIDLRNHLAKSIMGLMSASDFVLVSDMLFGQIYQLDPNNYHYLKITGMLHAVAASGFNIGLITTLTNIFASRFGRLKSFFIWLVCISIYLCMTDMSISIIRAYLMMLLRKSGTIVAKRNYHNLILLATASFLILLYKRSFLESISFQLSVAASLGIMLFVPLFSNGEAVVETCENSSLLALIKESFSTTLAAQLLTTPILIYHFAELSLLSLIVNVALAWLTPLITLGGLLLYFVSLLNIYLNLTLILRLLSLYIGVISKIFLWSISFFAEFDFLFIENLEVPQEILIIYLVFLALIYYKLLKGHEKKAIKNYSPYFIKPDLVVLDHT